MTDHQMVTGIESGSKSRQPADQPQACGERSADWLVGGGELGDLIRNADWSRTPPGPREAWPQSLRTAVNLVVASKLPMALLWGADLLLLYNDAYRVIAADKHPAALGRSTREIWAEVWHINEPIFAAVMQRGETLFFEDKPFRINRCGQWEEARFTLCYSPVYVEDGSVGGTLVILEDTTQRLRNEQALRQTTADLEEAQAIARIGSWKYVASTQEISWSKELFRIFDVESSSPRESQSGFAARVHPADQEMVRKVNLDAFERGLPFTLECRILTRAGGERWIREIGSAITAPDGTVTGLVGTVQDITERKRAEELIRESEARHAFLLSLSDALNAVGDPVDQQQIACRMLGQLLHADRVLYGEHHDDEGYVLVLPDYCREGLQSGAGRRSLADFAEVLQLQRAARTLAVADTEISPDLSERGRQACRDRGIRGFVGVNLVSEGKLTWTLAVVSGTPRNWTPHDVALVEETGSRTWAAVERARAEAALREANQQLAEGDRRKTAFLGLLSHELRNPLAPIANSLYILDHSLPGGEQAQRAKAVIGRQVAQLSELVNELLDVTRITHNKVRLHKEHIDLIALVSKSIEDHRSLFARTGVRLELLPSAGPAPIFADRTRVIQVLGNLLQNAAKFTPSGGSVVVTVETVDDHAVIRVRDDGIGMDLLTTLRAFEPFSQANQPVDRDDGCLGIGLALVKGFVELHGGTVGAHSDGPGKGAEFVVRLPLDREGRLAQMPDQPRGQRSIRRVLIIEDNVDAASSLREVLELLGHQVQVTHDGPLGLAKAREHKPDVLLCDIGLPGMSGFEVAHAFRADPSLAGVLLVALGGYASPHDLQRAAESGFERHLAKPATVEKLAEVLCADYRPPRAR